MNRVKLLNATDRDLAFAHAAVKTMWLRSMEIRWTGTLYLEPSGDWANGPQEFVTWFRGLKNAEKRKTKGDKHAPPAT